MKRHVWLLLLSACAWVSEPVDPSPPPSGAQLTLTVSPSAVVAGDTLTLRANGAPAGSSVYFVVGTSGVGAGPCPPALGGACLDLVFGTQGLNILGPRPADASGRATWVVPVPTVPPGTYAWQAVVPAGVDSRLSNPDLLTVFELNDTAPPGCSTPGALTALDDVVSGFHWGGQTPPSIAVPFVVDTPSCGGFVASSSAAWLTATVDESTDNVRIDVDPAALTSGRRVGIVEVRDRNNADIVETIEVRLDALMQPASGGTPKALVIGVDGLDGDEVGFVDTPFMDRLAQGGRYTYGASTQLTGVTLSGPGWTSLFTGVEVTRHGVTGNGGYSARNPIHETFAKRLRSGEGLRTVGAMQWSPILSIDEVDAFDVSSNGSQSSVTSDIVDALANGDFDVHVVHLDDVDGAGHAHGFVASQPAYAAAVRGADDDVGEMLDAILDRPTLGDENWLVILSADHGGTLGGSHGCMTADCQRIPLLVAGPSVPKDVIEPGEGSHLDITPTVMAFFGVDPAPLGFDGVSWLADAELSCADGVDDDGDGPADCADPDCVADPVCLVCTDDIDAGSTVGSEIVGPFVPISDSTSASCGGAGGADRTVAWTAPSPGAWSFDTMRCFRDTVLSVRDGGCGGPELACNESLQVARSAVVVDLAAGQPISIVIDSDGASGTSTCLSAYPVSTTCSNVVLTPAMGSFTEGYAHADVAYTGSCPPAVGVRWYAWTAPAGGTYTFETSGSDFDTVLYVLDGCAGAELACNDDASGLTSAASVTVASGQTLAIGVGSFGGRAATGIISLGWTP